jgi:hypothetical protein
MRTSAAELRAYEIAAALDLYRFWIVEMAYGRIGTHGRSKTRSFSSHGELGDLATRLAASPTFFVAGNASRGPASTSSRHMMDLRFKTWLVKTSGTTRRRIGVENILRLARIDVLPAAYDHVLASLYAAVTMFVQTTKVAGMQHL